MDFKDIIKSRRSALGLTLDDIARHVGVSGATVSRWESGDIENIRRDKIAKLAEVLHVTPAYLMGWQNAFGEQDLGLTAIDIAQWLNAPKDIVEAVVADMDWSDAANPETLSKISAEIERRKSLSLESGRNIAQTEDEEDMLLLARHMEPIPEDDRKQLKEQFKKSIDLYLKARGLSETEDK